MMARLYKITKILKKPKHGKGKKSGQFWSYDNLVDEDLAEQKIDLCFLSETNPKITGNTNLQFH